MEKKCACMIHVSGTLGGKFSRRQTGTADWDEAKSVVALLQQSASWDGQDKIEAPLTLPDTNPEPERISVIPNNFPNPQERFGAIAREYARLPEGTLVIPLDNKSRRELNSLIHREMQNRGDVSKDEHKFRVLESRQDNDGSRSPVGWAI